MFQLKLTPHVTFVAFDLSSNKMFGMFTCAYYVLCLLVQSPDPYVVNSEYV